MPTTTLRRGHDTITLELRLRAHREATGGSIGGSVRYTRGAQVATVHRRFYVESRAEYEAAVRELEADGYQGVPVDL